MRRYAFAYGVLYVVPVMWLVADPGRYSYWVASALGFLTLVLLLTGRSRASTALACAVSSLTTLGNLALAISLYIQRTGFNKRFFYHFDASSLEVAWHAYRPEVLLACLYWAVMTAGPLLVARAVRTRPGPAPRPVLWLATAVGLAAYAPAISLAAYGQCKRRRFHPACLSSVRIQVHRSGPPEQSMLELLPPEEHAGVGCRKRSGRSAAGPCAEHLRPPQLLFACGTRSAAKGPTPGAVTAFAAAPTPAQRLRFGSNARMTRAGLTLIRWFA